MGQLNGKVVVLTGGEGILGQAVTAPLDSAGARVASLHRAPAGAGASAAALRINSLDLGNPAEAAAAMAQVVERFGRLDVLVNVAGGFAWSQPRAARSTPGIACTRSMCAPR